MKPAAILLAIAGGAVIGAGALAQGAPDPMAKLRACSQLEGARRLECLDQLSRDIAPPAPTPPPPVASPPPAASPPAAAAAPPPPPRTPAPVAETWLVSETTSPVDYTPVVVANADATGGPGGSGVRLSIQCRAGRTELVVGGPPAPRGPEDYIVSYRINDGPEVPVAVGPPAAGVGAALRVDVARLLTSLPEAGELAVRVVTRQGATHEGAFSLAGIKTVRVRIAAPCKWPAAGESPRN